MLINLNLSLSRGYNEKMFETLKPPPSSFFHLSRRLFKHGLVLLPSLAEKNKKMFRCKNSIQSILENIENRAVTPKKWLQYKSNKICMRFYLLQDDCRMMKSRMFKCMYNLFAIVRLSAIWEKGANDQTVGLQDFLRLDSKPHSQ